MPLLLNMAICLMMRSHDTAWRSTARDFPISFENMALEAGVDVDDIPYLSEVLNASADWKKKIWT